MFFKDLPFELQAKILRSCETLKITSLYVSKSIYKEVITQIYNDEGQKLLTKSEVFNYISKYDPTQVCRFYFDKEGEWIYAAVNQYMHTSNTNHIINKYIWEDDIISQINTTTNVCINCHSINNGPIVLGKISCLDARYNILRKMNNRNDPYEYDLMTTYYCLNERLSCVNINLNYAKDKVLEIFQDNICSLDYEDLLVFLRGNAQIMGIYVKGFDRTYNSDYKNGFITDEAINEKIEKEVELLEKLILKRLESL